MDEKNTHKNRVNWHAMDLEEVLKNLEAQKEKGISQGRAEERLREYGPNALEGAEGKGMFALIVKQFKSPLIYLLIAAAIVASLAGKTVDSIVIALVVALNTFLGVVQEWRAEKALEALRKMSAPKAKVLRDGEAKVIESSNVVPGDILIIETGDSIAADARLITSSELQVDESALTGESEPVNKKPGKADAGQPLADQKNMVFMSTSVTGGKGRAVVVETGMNTSMGRIAGEVREAKREETPLQRRLGQLGTYIGILAVFLAAVVFGLGMLQGYELGEMLLFAVAVAVSSIPEGLPAVISVTLALGVRRMAERNAIIRRLPAVETLGSTTVICSDKTGTITKNEMTVVRIWAGGKNYCVSGQGFDPEGKIWPEVDGSCEVDPRRGEEKSNRALDLLQSIGCLANDSVLKKDEKGFRVEGTPTEGALLVVSRKAGLDPETFRESHPRKGEIPFSSEQKYMAALHQYPEEGLSLLLVKGAPERVLGFCSHVFEDGERVEVNEEHRRRVEEINHRFAGDALRVVAGAYREFPEDKDDISREEAQRDLTLAGMWGLVDPARPEAVRAISDAQEAGIKVVMITGDHGVTASAIARKVGIAGHDEEALTGAQIDRMSGEEFREKVKHTAVFARVSPSHKLRIMQSLQEKGEIVAMTGDGVNDAPALKSASIGVAMGKAGTEVAREAADMVLTDDNFATIVGAVEEGRVIFSNLRRVVFFLLTTNIGEVITLISALLIGLPLPVTAVMILWINLLTDGVSTVPLGIEPKHFNVLRQPPRSPSEGILDRTTLRRIILLAPVMAAGTLGLFWMKLEDNNLPYAQTVAFTTLAAFQWFQALNARTRYQSIFTIGLFTNKWLALGIAVAVVLQLSTVYLGPVRDLFGTVPLSIEDWGLAIVVAGSIFVIDEILKFFGIHGWLPVSEKEARREEREIFEKIPELERAYRIDRLWRYEIHEDNVFNNRSNFFLLGESLLLIAFALVRSSESPNPTVLYTIAVFGFLLVIVWTYVQCWQMANLDAIKKQLREVDHTYRDTARLRGSPLLSVTWLLSRMVPSVFGILWIFWSLILYLGR